MTHGFINLHKPSGWTSHDCVARVRRLLNTKKVGHSGTLDPLATGVLPLAVGKATRLLQYLPEGKAYQAIIRFGLQTTTDDLEGEVLQQQSAAHLQRQQVEAIFTQFVGTLTQFPPMYSAVQVAGKRLYDLARSGKAVEVPSRQVEVQQLRSRDWTTGEHPELTLDVVCGPGTYIRSLARDIGEAVGTGATLVGLVRTHSNGFDLTDSITIETLATEIEQMTFTPVLAGSMMQHLNAIALPPSLAQRWCLGQKLRVKELTPYIPDDQAPTHSHVPIRVIAASSQEFLGIGEFRPGLPTGEQPATAATLELSSSGLSGPHDTKPQTTDDASELIFAPKRVYASPLKS